MAGRGGDEDVCYALGVSQQATARACGEQGSARVVRAARQRTGGLRGCRAGERRRQQGRTGVSMSTMRLLWDECEEWARW